MSSLPTIKANQVFDQQWTILKAALENSNLNLETLNEVAGALLKISDSGGYGSVNISVMGGMVQQIEVKQTRKITALIIQET